MSNMSVLGVMSPRGYVRGGQKSAGDFVRRGLCPYTDPTNPAQKLQFKFQIKLYYSFIKFCKIIHTKCEIYIHYEYKTHGHVCKTSC